MNDKGEYEFTSKVEPFLRYLIYAEDEGRTEEIKAMAINMVVDFFNKYLPNYKK